MKSRHGFTLIELSIVLVIIGLIIGGIFVGRDLIHAAVIRATVKQVEQFDAAVNTFRTKFNCLPGDCTDPAAFGFTSNATNAGVNEAAPPGNGDGRISDDQGGQEIENAWWWLEQAGLVSNVSISWITGNQKYFTVIPAVIQSFQSYTFPNFPKWSLPYATWNVLYVDTGADIQTGNIFFTQSGHYYLLSSDIDMTGIPSAIMPVDAFAIDTKMDDGLPRSGRVLASGNDSADWSGPAGWGLPLSDPTDFNDEGPAGATSPYCVTGPPPAAETYNVQNTNSENDPNGIAVGPYCVIGIAAAF